MSTVEVKMFSLVCDRCGVDANEGTDYSAWGDDQTSRELAHDEGWITTDDGKDWCCDCIEWDEDGNEQRPKLSLPQ